MAEIKTNPIKYREKPLEHTSKGRSALILGVGGLILFAYYAIFRHYFPNANGNMGHDYSFFLPALLDGYFWFHKNGLWEIPWFTPSFCGGSLNYININNGYYTLPQFITFFTDPVTAVRLTFVIFAGIGLSGFYFLLRRAFFFSPAGSFLGATLFLFNGFYAHRMIIGHLGYFTFMLLPFITFFLLRPIPDEYPSRVRQLIFDTLFSGLLFATMLQSGFASFMIPGIISIIVCGLIHGLLYGRQIFFWLRFLWAGLAGILLSFSKLTAIFYLIMNFPRCSYSLPGAKSFLDAIFLAVKSVFFSPAFDPNRMEVMTNAQWALERHEWEYSLTFIPLLILLYGVWALCVKVKTKNFSLRLSLNQWIQVCAISLLLIIPVAVNTFSPAWNQFLKQIPLIKNCSSLIRWFIIYIPVVTLMAALAVERTALLKRHRLKIATIGILAIISINAATERDFYRNQNYNPDEIVDSYYKVKTNEWSPEIKAVWTYLDENNKPAMTGFRNNMLIHGASQLFCYEPMFGYRLETFPIKTLHIGKVLEAEGEILNIKNPACYIWPDANNCEPGDHFIQEQIDAATAFVSYSPFQFKTTALQKFANYINGIALVAAFILITICTTVSMYHFFKDKNR